MTATAMVSRTSNVKVYGSRRRLGASSIPLIPASAEPSTQPTAEMRPVSIPESWASSSESTAARTLRPARVRNVSARTAATASTTASSTMVWKRTTVSPGSVRTRPVTREGESVRACPPQIVNALPTRRTKTPTVAVSISAGEASRRCNGRNTPRSSDNPSSGHTPTTTTTAARPTGTCTTCTSHHTR